MYEFYSVDESVIKKAVECLRNNLNVLKLVEFVENINERTKKLEEKTREILGIDINTDYDMSSNKVYGYTTIELSDEQVEVLSRWLGTEMSNTVYVEVRESKSSDHVSIEERDIYDDFGRKIGKKLIVELVKDNYEFKIIYVTKGCEDYV